MVVPPKIIQHDAIFYWLVVWNHGIWIDFPIILGFSSSQLLLTHSLTPSFFRGVGLNHQPDMMINHHQPLILTININHIY